MAEKRQDSIPLLSDYDGTDAKGTLPSHQGDVAPSPPQSRALWKRASRFVLAGVTTFLVLRFLHQCSKHWQGPNYDVLMFAQDDDPLHYNWDHPSLSCETAVLNKTYWETEHDPFNFTLSPDFKDIRIFAHGPIFGEIEFTSGGTAGSDIEVSVGFEKFERHRPPHKKPEEETYEEEKEGYRFPWKKLPWPHKPKHPKHPKHRPHFPPPVVKACPFYAPDGHLEFIGLWAFHPIFHHPHHPHHPPHHTHSGLPHPTEGPGESYEITNPYLEPRSKSGCHRGSAEKSAWRSPLTASEDHPKHPKHPKPHHWPHFPHPKPVKAKIEVKFPSSSFKEVLPIKSFRTRLPGFRHNVGALNVEFDELLFAGAAIHNPHELASGNLTVVSYFGGVHGSYSASDQLVLAAKHGDIDVNVELSNDVGSEKTSPAKLVLVSEVGQILANVSLLTNDTDADNKPAFEVVAISKHNATFVDFVEQPVNSTLKGEFFSKGHPVFVKLAAAFEGKFSLSSIFSKPSLIVNDETKDPAGEDRKREVKLEKTWGPWYLKGSVSWVVESLKSVWPHHKEKPVDLVSVTTINAPATLVLK